MPDVLTNIGAVLLGIPLYVGGLLVWPLCAVFWRRTKRRARALRWVFFGQLFSLLVLIGFFVFSSGLLEHQYYWLIYIILLNILFAPLEIGAAIYDYGHGADDRAA
jgi:4-amino-4-deoxy-L-arabinose transferase-like glycosyltransferase